MFVKILNNTLKSIADAVRSKTGETGTMLPSEIPDKIKGISSGGVDLSTLADGTYKWGDYIATEKEIKTPVYSFQDMTSYTNPNLTSITSGNAFSQSKLTTFSAPNLSTVRGTFTFSYCSNLENVEFSDNLTTTSQAMFYACNGFEIVPRAAYWTNISGQAFACCNRLERAMVRNATNIESFAFTQCPRLKLVDLSKIIELKGHVFDTCHELSEVWIGENCKTINNLAFSNSRCQLNLTIEATTPPALNGAFTFASGGQIVSIKVPAESADEYKAAINWKAYSDIISAI